MDSLELNAFARNVYSQFGEDGILEKIFSIIGSTNGWCVEFGAWDGIKFSNTLNLIRNHNFSAVLIEGDVERFVELKGNFDDLLGKRVFPLNKFVGFGVDDNLDCLLRKTSIPSDFDFLSIDVDGIDYHVWDAVQNYHPKVVCIEYNPTIPNPVHFIQKRDREIQHGSSILALVTLGKEKGYELVAATTCNAFFIQNTYYSRFPISDNSIDSIRKDLSCITHIFSGYDGTVFFEGNGNLIWHRIPYDKSKCQQLPKIFRVYPDNMRPFMKFLFALYAKIRRKNK